MKKLPMLARKALVCFVGSLFFTVGWVLQLLFWPNTLNTVTYIALSAIFLTTTIAYLLKLRREEQREELYTQIDEEYEKLCHADPEL